MDYIGSPGPIPGPLGDWYQGEYIIEEAPSTESPGIPDRLRQEIERIKNDPYLDLPTKRRKILVLLGKRKIRGKSKYVTPEEKKVAARQRSKARRERNNATLDAYGLSPAPRGSKSEEEKRAARSVRGKTKRENFRELIKSNPLRAIKLGINLNYYFNSDEVEALMTRALLQEKDED